jgi:hypothetical protein
MSHEKPRVMSDAEKAEKELEKKLLDTVLEVAGDNETMVREGIIKALRNENDKARRAYLWNVLDKKAKEKIRRARKKSDI